MLPLWITTQGQRWTDSDALYLLATRRVSDATPDGAYRFITFTADPAAPRVKFATTRRDPSLSVGNVMAGFTIILQQRPKPVTSSAWTS